MAVRLKVGDCVSIEGKVIAHFPRDGMPWRVQFDAPLFTLQGELVKNGQRGPKTSYSVNSYLLKRSRKERSHARRP
jgi:hypothetical protein